MKFLWFHYKTREERAQAESIEMYKEMVSRIEQTMDELKEAHIAEIELQTAALDTIRCAYENLKSEFPFRLGDIVYGLTLRDNLDNVVERKIPPAYTHSEVEDIEVTKKNYFSLVTKWRAGKIFINYCDAQDALEQACGVSEASDDTDEEN